jgi:septal ring factor EnvC (AmiA/AmiB activator)
MMRLLSSICMATALVMPVVAAPQAPPPQGNDVPRIDDRIRSLQAEAQTLAGTSRTLVTELRRLEIERDLRTAEASKADAAVADGQRRIAALDARITTLEHERVTQLEDLEQQLVNLYKRGTLGYARLLFEARDVRELGRTSRTVATLIARDQRRLALHRKTVADLQAERQMREADGHELDTRRAAASQARAAASRAVAAHTARLAQIDAQRDLAAEYVGDLQAARDSLVRQLTTGATAPAALPLLAFRGGLDWPVDGRLTGLFGQSANRLGGSVVRNGVEISARDGTAVRAVHGGTVAQAAPFPGFGNLVIIDHGGNHYSLYGYLGAMTVAVGQTVSAGTEVGAVGPSPAGPSALYFELRVDGRSVDPVQWLKPR